MPENWTHRLKKIKAANAKMDFTNWSRADLIEYIQQLKEQVAVYEQTQASSTAKSKKMRSEKEFSQVWPYAMKVLFVFDLCDKPMTNFDLTSILLKLDKKLPLQNNAYNYVAVVLNRLIKLGRVKKIKLPGIRITYYALPEWEVHEANLMAEHFSYVTQNGV